MWKYIVATGIGIVVALVIRAGAGDVWRKIVFYGGAVTIIFLKITGIFATAISWPYAIVLGAVGVITDAQSTAIDDERALTLMSNGSK